MTIENSFILVIAVQWLSIITVLYCILRKLDNLMVLFTSLYHVLASFAPFEEYCKKVKKQGKENE